MEALLSRRKKITTIVMRLTDSERLFIILGMAVQSTVSFLPHNMDVHTVGLVYSCTNHASLILVLTPVVVYLNRITQSFNFLVLVGNMTFFLVSQLLFSFSFFFNTRLLKGAIICVFISLAFVILATLRAIHKFVTLKPAPNYAKKSGLTWFHNLRNFSYDEWKQNMINNPEVYATYIPAFHIVAALIIIAANFYVGNLPHDASVEKFDAKNFLVIIVETILLVTEFRFRKSEMEKGLVRLVLRNKLCLI
jgi:hypothetical protein